MTKETLEAIEAAEPNALPAIIRFLVHHTPTDADSVANIISHLRLRLKLPNSDDSGEITAAALTLEALVQGFTYREDLTTELIKSLQET